MEICGIICEFNPFHNGHEYLLERAREMSGCDLLLCVMSGNFTQRGDITVFDKYTRAKHAILGGADCVIELPTAFAVAPAEIFAKGAVKLLSAIPSLSALSFGAENKDIDELIKAAKISSDENSEFKTELSKNLNAGESYIKSFSNAFKTAGGDQNLISKPNNILAIEYIKAFNKIGKTVKYCAVKRQGAYYNNTDMLQNFSSASAIRKNINDEKVLSNVPPFVYSDISGCQDIATRYQSYLKLILSRTEPNELKCVLGCNEGLENVLKELENQPFDEIIEKATSKRYTSSRIKRILCENFLKLYEQGCKSYLTTPLYFTPLAVKKSSADSVFSALSQAKLPIITSSSDVNNLEGLAKQCKHSDDFAHSQWCQIAEKTVKNKMLLI